MELWKGLIQCGRGEEAGAQLSEQMVVLTYRKIKQVALGKAATTALLHRIILCT